MTASLRTSFAQCLPPSGRMPHRRGVTLLECLATIALLTLATGTLAVCLPRFTSTRSASDVLEICLEAERFARLHASRGRSTMLVVSPGRIQVEARIDGEQTEVIFRRSLPRGEFIRLFVGNREVTVLEFSSLGTTRDHQVRAGKANVGLVVHINGASGWAQRQELDI